MNRKEYYDKLRKWEAEGYDVSELRQKWFPPKRRRGGSQVKIWFSGFVVVFIVVAGIVIWQAMQPSSSSSPEDQNPSSFLSKTETSTSTSSLSPALVTTTIPPQAAVVRYALSTFCIPTGSGGISPPSGSYDNGTSMKLTATAAPGYRFDYWSGDFSGTSPTVVFNMDSDKNIIANFTPILHSLSTMIAPTGAGSVNPNGGNYNEGLQLTITATPLFPYAFENWEGTDNNNINPTIVTMSTDKSVTANYVKLVGQPPIEKSGHISNGIVMIPINLNQYEWIQGDVNAGTWPGVQVYIQDPTGSRIKDFGKIGLANFAIMAGTSGRYNVVIEANFFYPADYTINYIIYGLETR